jgi:hypothetical protein
VFEKCKFYFPIQNISSPFLAAKTVICPSNQFELQPILILTRFPNIDLTKQSKAHTKESNTHRPLGLVVLFFADLKGNQFAANQLWAHLGTPTQSLPLHNTSPPPPTQPHSADVHSHTTTCHTRPVKKLYSVLSSIFTSKD